MKGAHPLLWLVAGAVLAFLVLLLLPKVELRGLVSMPPQFGRCSPSWCSRA